MTGGRGRAATRGGAAASGEKQPRRSRLSVLGEKVKVGAHEVRSRVASACWLVALLAAVVLAVAALLYALGANQHNQVVKDVLALARTIAGPLGTIFTFGQDTAKEHLVNWGIAAAVYLVVGRIVDRVIRP